MFKSRFFVKMALRNLLRGGQRVFIALLVIAFGTMSLVSMTSVSDVLSQGLLVSGEEIIGGSMSLTPLNSDYIGQEQINGLADLKADGKIEQFTVIANNNNVAFHKADSGTLHFPLDATGIDPFAYPLVGEIKLQSSDNEFSDLLQNLGDVVMTIDLAVRYDFTVGDTILLNDIETGSVVTGRVTGLIVDVPNHQGNQIFYNYETAAALTPTSPFTNVLILAPSSDELIAELETMGWFSFPVEILMVDQADRNQFINLSFKGAGVLGLLVGGIGIANTMQVLLARRSKEVAILKSLGFTQRHMLFLFLSEAALLGFVGSLLGLGFGIAVHSWLIHLFTKMISVLITNIHFNVFTLISSVLVGIITTLIFSAYAIVRSGNVRPAVLLRNEAVQIDSMGWKRSIALIAGLLLPFVLVTSFVMKSLIAGLGVIILALLGLVVLGFLMLVLIFIVSRVIPKTHFPVQNLVRNNLRSRGIESVSAMIALFIGIVTLTLAGIVTDTAQREMNEHSIIIEGQNLTIVANPAEQANIEAVLQSNDLKPVGQGAIKLVEQITVIDGEAAGRYQTPKLIGRDKPIDYLINGQEWDAANQGVYVYVYSDIPVGANIQVTLSDGSKVVYPVIGTYELNYYSPTSSFGLLMHSDLLQSSISEVDSISYYFEVADNHLNQIAKDLGEALPNSTVINHTSYFARFTETFENLFVLALSMAGLAILAGVLLIANTVNLALLNRRYELGVLKAVGYTRQKLTASLLWEYATIAFISTGLGMVSVWGFVQIFAMINEQAGNLLRITPITAIISAGVGILLPLVFVFFVIQQPLALSPINILQDRD